MFIKLENQYTDILNIARLFLACNLIFALLGMIFAFVKNKNYRFYFSLGLLFLITLNFYYTAIHYALPFYETFKPSKTLVMAVKKDYPDTKFSAFTFDEWRLSSFVFYLNAKKGFTILSPKKDKLIATLNLKEPVIIFINKDTYQKIKDNLPNNRLIEVSYDSAVITNLK
ncbi:MAG: hypothetical protein WC860_07635 [Candidatus Margulisiibacteriota bacterium]